MLTLFTSFIESMTTAAPYFESPSSFGNLPITFEPQRK